MNFCKFLALLLLLATLTGCDALHDGGDSEPENHRIAGTVAQGRPGSWSEVCLGDHCSRANRQGDYLLLAPFTEPGLLRALIPEVDGTERILYGLVDHDEEQTTYLANINPTTHALLDAWSRFAEGLSLEECLTDNRCESRIADDLDQEVRQSTAAFLRAWLNPVWLTERDPFHAPYRADPTLDWLDRFHDHFHFANDATSLALLDNNSASLAIVSHEDLFDSDVAPDAISQALADAALAIAPMNPTAASPITIRWQADPGLSLDAPGPFTLNASGSSSIEPGELFIQLEWVTPQGEMRRFNQAQASVDIEQGGNHLWVITVTDSADNRLSQGLTLESRRADTLTDPQYGADGSCQTTAMTSNSANICEETVDGGLLGACEPTTSGQTLTQKTPAPCSPIAQNGGVFLGICTSVFNELRVFHYDNPLRSTGESLDEQRAREAERCAALLGSSWSTDP